MLAKSSWLALGLGIGDDWGWLGMTGRNLNFLSFSRFPFKQLEEACRSIKEYQGKDASKLS